MKNLVKNSKLNVSPTGTQIAIMIFSKTDRTKLLVNFGDKPTQTDIETYMSSGDFTWNKLSGDRTRTGLALHKINRVRYSNNLSIQQCIAFDVVLLLQYY